MLRSTDLNTLNLDGLRNNVAYSNIADTFSMHHLGSYTVYGCNYSFSANSSFPNYGNSSTLTLVQWQYWWWFWFTTMLVLLIVIMSRLIYRRIMHMSPKLTTSLRSHGRWGDLLICAIPIFWCLNILSSSHFLLRHLEWQSANSALTLRVRGKQWYWVYKYDIRALQDGDGQNIIVGDNKLVNLGDSSLLSTISSNVLNSTVTVSKDRIFDFTNKIVKSQVINTQLLNSSVTNQIIGTSYGGASTANIPNNVVLTNISSAACLNLHNFRTNLRDLTQVRTMLCIVRAFNNVFTDFRSYGAGIAHTTSTLVDGTTTGNRLLKPTSLHKNRLSLYNTSGYGNSLLSIRFSESGESVRDLNKNTRLTITQKKVEPIILSGSLLSKNLSATNFSTLDNYNLNKPNNQYFDASYAKLRGSFENYNNSSRFDNQRVDIYHNKRLLWVTKQIVLPTSTAITVITNSFDVIHSWFVPGIGLKLDCVPGRSTHHTIFVERPGYYYGQCAEVCGRRHHHMPIKILFVPFTHFLFWWNSKIKSKLTGSLASDQN